MRIVNDYDDNNNNNSTSPPTTTTTPSSWMGWKEKGKTEYERCNYKDALDSYRTAITLSCPADERQIMLSNMVACRLKIGGRAQAEAAVETAKQVSRVVCCTYTILYIIYYLFYGSLGLSLRYGLLLV
jgi:hypothetical protein